jgi:hypothetical protein
MRKIEFQMNKAICDCTDWKNDNTEVTYSPERDASYVMLHGNHIATIGDTFLELVGIKLLPPNHVSMLYWKFTEMMPVSFNVTLNGLWLIMATQFLSLKVWCLTDD